MHTLIINGSPREKQISNTERIIKSFAEGMKNGDNTFEIYSLSNRNMWDIARDAYDACDNILIALPLEGDRVPGALTEFMETLTPKDKETTISFILHGGSDESIELENGEGQLKEIAEKLGCTYGGTEVMCSNPNLRFMEDKKLKKATAPYRKMGQRYGKNGYLVAV
jgi:multimeric flavodoxin WrbA